MSRVRRPAVAAEAARRTAEQRARIGGDVRRSRVARSWTQAQLAERAGLGRLVVGRIERAVASLDVDALQRIGLALGRPLDLRFDRDIREGPLDAGHLGLQELALRLGQGSGYEGLFELPSRPAEPWRSVDVGLRSDARRRLVLVECWNTIGDVGAAARSSERKRAELEAAATARWGADATVGIVWVVRATARNRDLVARYPAVFASRFPGSSRAWVAALTTGTPPPAEPGLVWSDVGATRIFEWRASPGWEQPRGISS